MIKTNLGCYTEILTDDGTCTWHSPLFDENFHNTSGAYAETLYNYIEGTKIKSRVVNAQSEFNVLDVGFGAGIGLLALANTYRELHQIPDHLTLNYVSIELDPGLVHYFLKIHFPHVSFFECENKITGTVEKINVTIFLGDGTHTLKAWDKPLHSIFQDAFSPRKNPALWTTDWFELLKSLSAPDVILSTYSSSQSVRTNLLAAGFAIQTVPGFASKKSMTIAHLSK